MKNVLVGMTVFLSIAAFTGGCERNDYQHPLHRSTK